MICLSLALIPVAGCKPNGTSANKVITENNNGSTITIKNGDTLTLKLNAQSWDGGYSWKIDMSSGLCLIESKNDQIYKGRMGSPMIQSWKIKAVTNGIQQITGIYKRSWEQSTDYDETFTVNVEVI
jgi:Predicted secreted protein